MNIVIRVSDETKKKMIEYYKDKRRDKVIPYVVFQATEEDTVITMYESGKIMFQGTSADVDADRWKVIDGQSTEKQEEKKRKESIYYDCSSVGSDEVGTGDYFGPIVVCSAYVKKEDVPYLTELGIKDSKKLTDEQILKIVPQMIKRIKYKSVLLSNKEYYNKDVNMNKIKAILHNKMLYQLIEEEKPTYDYIIVDEFAKEHKYYEYIQESTHIQRGITFMTKAEDKNLAVACASMIARYIFIKEFDKLSDSLHIPLPKGAGPNVDAVGQEIVEKYGKDKLKEVAKLNFLNTGRILKTLII